MRLNYKKIGNYVKTINNRNHDLQVQNLQGINIYKEFMPSVANIIGVDLSKYKLVTKYQFAFNPMHVGRDEMLPISIFMSDKPIIVSPAYTVFEIKDHQCLDPEYFMMWCRRPEFDRNAWFTTDSSVRGGFNWDDFCEMELPVPSITRQREIFSKYNTVVENIKLNQEINQKLEETAAAVYKSWFVDFEFPITSKYAQSICKPELESRPYKSSGGKMIFCEELNQDIPKDWEKIDVGSFCKEMKNGATPKRDNPEYWNSEDIAWIKTGEISNNVIWNAEEYISELGYENSSTKILPENTVLMAMYGATAAKISYLKIKATTNQACCAMVCGCSKKAAYLYYRLLNNQDEIKRSSIGGAQENLSKAIIEKLYIFYAEEDFPDLSILSNLLEKKALITKKIYKFKQLLSLLLSSMANEKCKGDLAE